MITALSRLADLLKGRITSPEGLAEGRVKLSLRLFVPLATALGMLYGLFMGWYAISLYWGGTVPDPHRLWQVVASTVKLPMLFLLTLVVTFPSLYVFNALFGGRASFSDTLRLLVGAVTINLVVAASFGPILGFFTLSTTSYSFMVLLNVVLLAIAGMVALAFLLQTLRRMVYPVVQLLPVRRNPPEQTDDADEPDDAPKAPPTRPMGALDRPPSPPPPQAKNVFQVWVLIYALVGAQMSWVLRPFIGSPNMPFEWFRPRSGNFFQAVMASLQHLLGMH